MTNFNIRMELDGKSELVTAWSLVRPTSHRVDTHMHARTICKTGIADRIVSKSYVLVHFKASYRTKMLPGEGWDFDDPNQSAHPCLSAKNKDSSKTANRSWKEHHGKCVRRFLKRKMLLEKRRQKVLMTNIPSDFKTISFEHFTLWETWFCCSVTHAQYMHRLALQIR